MEVWKMDNAVLVAKAVEYARNNLDNHDLSVQNVACAAGFSLDYFNNIFFAHTGFTVMAYISHMRLKKAAYMLRSTEKTVLQIAMECGYESHEGFARAFTRKYALSPSEYRKQKKNLIIRYAELSDQSVAARFLRENPDFTALDPDEVIEYLLESDVKKYGRICAGIKYMGMTVAAPGGNFKEGFLTIRDDLKGGRQLEIIADDLNRIKKWVERFGGNISVWSMAPLEEILGMLSGRMIKCQPLCVYTGNAPEYHLPESVSIRTLTASDADSIRKWAAGRDNAYISHLLTPDHYNDESVLEYGVFRGNDLIAVAGCGVDSIHGMCLNDCCIIRFADGEDRQELYKPIYLAVTDDMWKNGIIPCDVIQFGEYAQQHGNFCASEAGFETVNHIYHIG